MRNVTGEIHYGGRVTDEWDRNLLLNILKRFYTPEILEEGYRFSESGTYYAPNFDTLEEYRNFIEQLPNNDEPEVFGMHPNANITYQSQESEKIVYTIL